MKQPLMCIPPAQAEALHDAALAWPRPGVETPPEFLLADEWDDEADSPLPERGPRSLTPSGRGAPRTGSVPGTARD